MLNPGTGKKGYSDRSFIKALVRESGDIAGTSGCKLVGPAGEIDVEEGVIAAMRHVHMTPEDAEHYGVENGQIVSVKVFNEVDDSRSLIFDNTVVRVSSSYALAMHIDTDESNAAGAPVKGYIVK